MLFREHDINFTIHEVLRFNRKSVFYNTEKRNFYVLSCRLLGETDFYRGEQQVRADAHHYVLLPPNITYSQKSSDEEIICIHFSADCAPFQDIRVAHSPSFGVQQRFINLYDLWKKKQPGYILQCKSILYSILHELTAEANPEKQILTPAIDYILAHFNEQEFDINDAIEQARISPAYFRRIFRQCYGQPPIQFVNGLRIDYAKALLEGRTLSVAEIAEKAGFSDEKYFYTVFKKQVGISPTRWLNQ